MNKYEEISEAFDSSIKVYKTFIDIIDNPEEKQKFVNEVKDCAPELLAKIILDYDDKANSLIDHIKKTQEKYIVIGLEHMNDKQLYVLEEKAIERAMNDDSININPETELMYIGSIGIKKYDDIMDRLIRDNDVQNPNITFLKKIQDEVNKRYETIGHE